MPEYFKVLASIEAVFTTIVWGCFAIMTVQALRNDLIPTWIAYLKRNNMR